MRELSEQNLLGRPVFIREVGLSFCASVNSPLTHYHLRTERMSHVSVLLPFPARSVWLWPAAACMLPLPLGLPITTTLANPAATLVTNYMSATYVINACSRYNID